MHELGIRQQRSHLHILVLMEVQGYHNNASPSAAFLFFSAATRSCSAFSAAA
jgi:hypothetical protein